jgi:hypothetical protein
MSTCNVYKCQGLHINNDFELNRISSTANEV